nr:unnamed protein product [Spirometra erinaceieuropaei]
MVSKKPTKVFQDAVHGLIEVESLMLKVIDTAEFQRLRNIKQLGPVAFVFPTCTHTRFEHSLGTYHLISRLLRAIQADVPCEAVRLTEAECTAVKLAALCHDLGHGPFSHLWEYFMRSGGPKYRVATHEKLSGRILRRIVEQNPDVAASISEAAVDLDLVCALIEGRPSEEQLKSLKEKSFIFELLSNSTNGMDVDKWDYILRDSFYLGWGQGCSTLELERFLWFYRLVFHPSKAASGCGGEESSGCWHMSFRDSEIENVLRTFTHRLHLHRQDRLHKDNVDHPANDNRSTFYRSRRLVKQRLLEMQDAWTACKAEGIQVNADRNEWKNFSTMKAVYGPPTRAAAPLCSADGTILLTKKTQPLQRWVERFRGVLNRSSTISNTAITVCRKWRPTSTSTSRPLSTKPSVRAAAPQRESAWIEPDSCLVLSAILMDAYRDERRGIRIAYRTDGHLLNQRRMHFQYRVSTTTVHELLFADDCVLNITSKE